LHRLEREYSSLAGCYALPASLVVLFLLYIRVAFLSDAPDLSSLIFRPLSDHAPRWHLWLDFARDAVSVFRERMHTTWLFFGVFAAVWVACLLWMQVMRSRRQLSFNRQEAIWTAWMSLAVFSAAVLYGLGTNGVFPQRLPQLVTASDIAAVGLILALPLIAWSRLHRRQQEVLDDSGESLLPRRSSGFLGLDDDESNTRLAENFSLREVRPDVRPVDLLPAVQIFHERPGEHARAAADRLIESTELPVIAEVSEPPAVAVAPIPVTVPLVSSTADMPPTKDPATKGINGFRRHLSSMNSSWQNIESIREEIDDWFEQRRQQAIAHLDTHPGMRSSTLARNLFNDFPNDKLSAVDAEWAEIRRAALEISRWFGDAPAPEPNH
jgi:hypothetical protein